MILPNIKKIKDCAKITWFLKGDMYKEARTLFYSKVRTIIVYNNVYKFTSSYVNFV